MSHLYCNSNLQSTLGVFPYHTVRYHRLDFEYLFQHYLTMFGATVAIPLIVAPALCVGDDNVTKSEILGTLLFVSGLVTLLQSTLGVR